MMMQFAGGTEIFFAFEAKRDFPVKQFSGFSKYL